MICLAVQTANSSLAVALCASDGKVLYSFSAPEVRDQGNLLFEKIATGLKTEGISYPDLGLLAVATGPGSFTGIRIGLAAVRGIALAAGLPALGVNSFDLYHEAVQGRKTLVVLESWRAEPYAQLDGHAVLNILPQELADLYAGQGPLHICGDGSQHVATIFKGASVSTHQPDATRLADIALRRYAKEPAVAEVAPTAYYVREADVTFSSKAGQKHG